MANNTTSSKTKTVLIDPTTALVFLCLLAFVTILLNVAALIVTYSAGKRKHSVNYPLIWLLIANILIGMFPLPIYALKKYGFESSVITSRLCDAWRYTYFTTIHLAMASLMIMTFDKIICLSFPFHYQQYLSKLKINIILCFSWIFLIIFDMVPFFPINKTDREFCHYKIRKSWAISMNIITMAIPLPVITVCYSYMVVLAYRQAVGIRRNTVIDGQSRRPSKVGSFKFLMEIKATKYVAYIVGSYIICWTPGTLYYLLVWLCKSCYPKNYQPHKTWIRFFFKILVMYHGCITPVVFCWHSKLFRKDVKRFVSSIGSDKAQLPENSRKSKRVSFQSNSCRVTFKSGISESQKGTVDSRIITLGNSQDADNSCIPSTSERIEGSECDKSHSSDTKVCDDM